MRINIKEVEETNLISIRNNLYISFSYIGKRHLFYKCEGLTYYKNIYDSILVMLAITLTYKSTCKLYSY